MFQSLFYWILFSYSCQQFPAVIPVPRFNPYSIGFYSLIKGNVYCTRNRGRFQSLFYWILFSYTTENQFYTRVKTVSILILLDSILLFYGLFSRNTRIKSFNPYSIGFYSLILSFKLRMSPPSICFNPYSIGFYSLIKLYLVYNDTSCGFQSLFYWILFSY